MPPKIEVQVSPDIILKKCPGYMRDVDAKLPRDAFIAMDEYGVISVTYEGGLYAPASIETGCVLVWPIPPSANSKYISIFLKTFLPMFQDVFNGFEVRQCEKTNLRKGFLTPDADATNQRLWGGVKLMLHELPIARCTVLTVNEYVCGRDSLNDLFGMWPDKMDLEDVADAFVEAARKNKKTFVENASREAFAQELRNWALRITFEAPQNLRPHHLRALLHCDLISLSKAQSIAKENGYHLDGALIGYENHVENRVCGSCEDDTPCVLYSYIDRDAIRAGNENVAPDYYVCYYIKKTGNELQSKVFRTANKEDLPVEIQGALWDLETLI